MGFGAGQTVDGTKNMPDITVKGLKLHYEERGPATAPPVVFIPGLSGNHLAWGNVVQPLQARYRCIIIDPRDAGESGQASGPYTIRDMAGDVVGVIRALGLTRPALVGFSMGGAICQELAITHPELLSRLVLVATYDTDDPRGTFIFQHFTRLRRILSREDYHRTLLPWVYTHEELGILIDPEVMVKRLASSPLFLSPEAYERQAHATNTFRSKERLHLITTPTLLIFGDHDLFTPLRFAHSLHAGITGSKLALLGGTGHGILFTRGSEVAALVHDFLRERG